MPEARLLLPIDHVQAPQESAAAACEQRGSQSNGVQVPAFNPHSASQLGPQPQGINNVQDSGMEEQKQQKKPAGSLLAVTPNPDPGYGRQKSMLAETPKPGSVCDPDERDQVNACVMEQEKFIASSK